PSLPTPSSTHTPLTFHTHPTPPTTYPLSLHDALPISMAGLFLVYRSIPFHLPDRGLIVDSLQRGWPMFLFRSAATLYTMGNRNIDRKSTRLNSSHRTISYAVFCLKKKKK